MIAQLQEWASERGYRIACGNVRVLHEVRTELEKRRSTGELDESFFENYLGFFRYEKSSANMADVKGVIVVALPRPAHQVTFETATGPFSVILPPTYLRYRAIFKEVRDDIAAAIPGLRRHLEILAGPLKAIAGRLGLVMYGRNNVTYIPEWGSYHQLVGYLTDIDLGVPEEWQPDPAQLMPECTTCRACASACPTGAISDERLLLHAERCTTLFSEQHGDLEHDLSADCLFGCLECQQICPMNSGLLQVVSAGVSFDKNETEAILTGDTARWETIDAKFAVLGLTEEPLIGRNLAHLIARGAQGL